MRLAKRQGTCSARMVRYYFIAKKGRCNRFIYSGCDGNVQHRRMRQSLQEKKQVLIKLTSHSYLLLNQVLQSLFNFVLHVFSFLLHLSKSDKRNQDSSDNQKEIFRIYRLDRENRQTFGCFKVFCRNIAVFQPPIILFRSYW